jgi:hypothetical protein
MNDKRMNTAEALFVRLFENGQFDVESKTANIEVNPMDYVYFQNQVNFAFYPARLIVGDYRNSSFLRGGGCASCEPGKRPLTYHIE